MVGEKEMNDWAMHKTKSKFKLKYEEKDYMEQKLINRNWMSMNGKAKAK